MASKSKAPKPETAAKAAAPTVETADTAPVAETATASPVVERATPPAPKANTAKVKFLRSHPGFGYFPGNTGEVPAEQVADLVKGKFVEEVK